MNKTPATQQASTTTFIPSSGNLLQRKCACGNHTMAGGECTECAKKKTGLQRKAVNQSEASGVPPIVHEVLRSPGQPLDSATRAFFESRLKHDFSQVRVYTDTRAAESAREVGARAYTVGPCIVFADNQYTPDTERGKKLLAHELTHVVQQSYGMTGSEKDFEVHAEAQERAVTFSSMSYRAINNPHHRRRMQLKPDRITNITVNLATSIVTLTLDCGESISGSITSTNLLPGNYQALWDSSTGAMAINPWPTREQIIHFVVSGTRPFLQRYDRLRRAISEQIPFNVVSEAPTQAPATQPTAATVAPAEGTSLSSEEAQRRCEANDLPGIKVFPFRGTRAGAAPISAWQDGDAVVVKLPVYVLANDDFRRQTRTLPTQTFTSGVRLRPNELVRVHVYEPRWYHLNITGSTEGDMEREFCVTGEQMLQIGDASTRATIFNIGLTAFEAATFFVPVGRIASAAARPLLRAGQTGVAAAMIGTAEVAPTAFAGAASRAAVTVVEEQVERQVVGQAIRQTVSQTVVQTAERGVAEAAVPRSAAVAVPRVGSGIVGTAVSTGAVETAIDVAGGVVRPTAASSARAPIAGAEEITLSEAEYRAALEMVFPSQFANQLARTVDGIGQRAAQRAMANPQFVAAVQSGNWTLGGTLFHSAAAQEVRALSASALPSGWVIEAERVIQAGAGGSRADVLLRGPAGQIVEFDWKTTGRSALSYSSRQEMTRHAGQITTNIGGTLTTQESRSWIDYVRTLLPGVNWPR